MITKITDIDNIMIQLYYNVMLYDENYDHLPAETINLLFTTHLYPVILCDAPKKGKECRCSADVLPISVSIILSNHVYHVLPLCILQGLT